MGWAVKRWCLAEAVAEAVAVHAWTAGAWAASASGAACRPLGT